MEHLEYSHQLLIGLLTARPVTASVTGPGEGEVLSLDRAVHLINERVAPPIPITADDVHVRILRLISDEVNDHGGRFPRDEHARLCELLIDTPVLIGHDRSGLPVARNFDARCVADGERQWIEVSCYWLRSPFGDRLAGDIDAGVVKEGSIGFEFRRPECSICGDDIRSCEHVPGHEYSDAEGTVHLAHYEYRDIVRVLETSLVYRGATPGTHFVRQAVFQKTPAQGRHAMPKGAETAPLPVTGSGASEIASAGDGPPEPFKHVGVGSPDPGTPQPVEIRNVPDHAVVLGCNMNASGDHRYLVARRDDDDPSACDELTISSPEIFTVGEHIELRDGRWRSVPLHHPQSRTLKDYSTQPNASLLRLCQAPDGRSPRRGERPHSSHTLKWETFHSGRTRVGIGATLRAGDAR